MDFSKVARERVPSLEKSVGRGAGRRPPGPHPSTPPDSTVYKLFNDIDTIQQTSNDYKLNSLTALCRVPTLLKYRPITKQANITVSVSVGRYCITLTRATTRALFVGETRGEGGGGTLNKMDATPLTKSQKQLELD